jgi:hypothetical protein
LIEVCGAVSTSAEKEKWKWHWRSARAFSEVMLPRFIVRRNEMTIGTILLIVLVLMLIGAIPTWPHSRQWGYGPSGGLGLVVVILLILWLLGKI